MDRDQIYQHQGFGDATGLGRLCALLIVDYVNGFVDIDQFGGPMIEEASRHTVPLLELFRSRGLPIAHTRVVFDADGANVNQFALKVKPLQKLTEQATGSQIVPWLTPANGELIVRKQSASAFFNTGLADWLRFKGADTVLVTGCTTSGCVRASVVDSLQHNFRTVVVTDCVADRAIEPHEANLFDMGQKYADLMSRDSLIAQLTA
jgi:maleamate amidohydrolase